MAVATALPAIGSADWSPMGMLPSPDWNTEFPLRAPIVGLNAARRAWTPEEKEIEIEADDLLAVALQHEIDHLDGKLFIDRISRIKRELYRRKLAKLIKEGKADGQRPSSVRI